MSLCVCVGPTLSTVNSDFSLKLSARLQANAESWNLDNPLHNTHKYTHTKALSSLLTYRPRINSAVTWREIFLNIKDGGRGDKRRGRRIERKKSRERCGREMWSVPIQRQ